MKFTFLVLVVLLFCGCYKKEKEKPQDFESLMGKGTGAWQYVQTKEDFAHLTFFKKWYEENITLLHAQAQNSKIPHVVHFIWLGPKPFPRASIENVRSWMGKHPDWKFCFWTDRERPLPCPGMEKRFLKNFTFLKMRDCFDKTESYGEKADLLRYEILYQEGGVYVDHDVKCLKNFDLFNQNYDFYCGMDMPFTSSLPSCILPTNNLIGARPGHPVLISCMERLENEWSAIEVDYPGTDRDSVLNRVLHRTYLKFAEAIMELGNQDSNHDIVLPAFYFDAPSDDQALFARHLYAGSWFQSETKFEKMVRERLMYLSKKCNRLLLFVAVLSLINLTILSYIFYAKRRAA